MTHTLPIDLKEAEEELFKSTEQLLSSQFHNRLSITLKFEGLKIEPIAIRFAKKYLKRDIKLFLAFSDFGSAALTKRDAPELSSFIYTFKDICNSNEILNINQPIIAIAPQPYDYEVFAAMVTKISSTNTIIMFNGKLEDTAIGIGSVGRDRKSSFIKSWKVAYWLEPLNKGALLYDCNDKWQLFSYSAEGYIFLKTFDQKPDDLLIDSYI